MESHTEEEEEEEEEKINSAATLSLQYTEVCWQRVSSLRVWESASSQGNAIDSC